jgi:hypothetical protein
LLSSREEVSQQMFDDACRRKLMEMKRRKKRLSERLEASTEPGEAEGRRREEVESTIADKSIGPDWSDFVRRVPALGKDPS